MSDAYQMLRDKEVAEKAEYQAWLLSLKDGDQVALAICTLGNSTYRILTVSRITATQIIFGAATAETRIDRKTGRVRGGSYGRRIVQVTQKVRDAIELCGLHNWLSSVQRTANSLPVLRAMKQAFDTSTAAEDKKRAKS